MRIVFLMLVLAGSIYYSHVAFFDLNFFTRSGRLGPGFFPRVVGVAMMVLTLWSLTDALRERRLTDATAGTWPDVLKLMALAVAYAVSLRLLGGFPATVIFLGLALLIINRGHLVQNAILTVAIPSAIYLLFDRVLNANMPPALLNLPF